MEQAGAARSRQTTTEPTTTTSHDGRLAAAFAYDRPVSDDGVFADVLRANEAYAASHSADVPAGAARKLAVLTCIDSRLDPLAMLGLKVGDAKILRNAGARVTDDALRTLVLAAHLLGVERLMIVGHTRCRGIAPDDDAVRASIREAGGPDTGEMRFLSTPDPEIAVREDCATVRAHPLLTGLRVGGFVFDVDSGRLRAVV